jgi:hypothetical protein
MALWLLMENLFDRQGIVSVRSTDPTPSELHKKRYLNVLSLLRPLGLGVAWAGRS